MFRVGFELTILVGEDGSCFRPRGHCDRILIFYTIIMYVVKGLLLNNIREKQIKG
jgi:hypothetical protein